MWRQAKCPQSCAVVIALLLKDGEDEVVFELDGFGDDLKCTSFGGPQGVSDGVAQTLTDSLVFTGQLCFI